MAEDTIDHGQAPARYEEEVAELRFSQEHYDRLTRGQDAWLEWRREGMERQWSEFKWHKPDEAAVIEAAISDWNANPPQPALLEGARLRLVYLPGVQFFRAHLRGAQMFRAHFEGAKFVMSDLEGAEMREAHFEGADLRESVLEGADLRGAKLDKANLGGAQATRAVFWGASLNRTKLDHLAFRPEHPTMNDGTDTLSLPRRDWLSWGRIRTIGTLPLFGASYVALGGTLTMINGLNFVNEHWDLALPPPERTLWLTLSSLLLVLGTTIYKLACPERVQAFSEAEWVEQHGKARLQYLAASLSRRWQFSAVFFTLLGGLSGLVLLIERVWVAIWYLVFLFLLGQIIG